MDDENLSLLSFPRRSVTQCLTDDSVSNAMSVSISKLIAALGSRGFGLDDYTSMESTPFGRVCLNNNQSSSRCQKLKNVPSLFWT